MMGWGGSGGHTEEDVGDESVGIVHVLVGDVAHGQAIQLGLAAAALGVQREEDGPCDAAADKGDEGEDLEVSQEEVGVQRGVVEHGGVLDLEEGLHPVEPGVGQRLTPLPWAR